MLKKFKNWLIENNYKINTAKDYEGRIERLCKIVIVHIHQ